ncbi:MAG: hypothetical protein ACR2NN_14345 [Bryobacteraceae bacterium]
MADFLDEAMGAQAFGRAGYLAAVEFRQMAAEGFVLESADIELTANDGAEQRLVVGVEQIETGIATAFLLDGLGEFVELVPAGARIVDGGEELQTRSRPD